MIPQKQLSLADIFSDCQNKFDNDKYQFLELLENTIDLDEIVPVSFILHFHAATGRPRKHQLYSMLKALLLQLIFSIPTVSLLIIFLKYSKQLRDFCGFDVVPDFSWAMPRLIPLRSTNTSCWKRLLKKPLSRLTAEFPCLNQTAP